ALPDVRDGFKPVHRRILYGMLGIGNTSDAPYKKCARVVGEVLGKYHPHGDSSVYGALVRMGQDWNMRYNLVDGQGNFGSVDGDSPAAMRYTECRLSKMGEHIMDDIKKDTVDMSLNFDDTLYEPTVMPTKIPNLLVNGGNGIAVGMATNMPTHNLCEVIDGCCAYIDNPDIDTDGLMQYIKAPDFPTGGYIYGLQGVRDAYETGRGRIVMRAKAEIESDDSHDKIVITEIPYGVNKALLIENIAELVKEGKLDGISNANDETGRQGMRIVIDVKRDANANVVMNKLFKMTAMQSSFSVNNIALVNGRPKLLTLKECVHYFVEHRRDVTIRRTKYDLKKAEERAHILEGLLIAVNNIDEVVRLIRASKSPSDAQRALEARFQIDELQSKAIVDMRLGQLTGLRVDELKAEYEELLRLIEYYNNILTDPELCKKVMKDELQEVKEKYGDERRTEIKFTSEEFNPEDFYPNDPIAVTISNLGYIKRMNQTEFKQQHRGGVGVKAAATRDADFTRYIVPAMTHDWMLFFTAKGRVFWTRCYEIPEGNKQSKGRAMQNFLNISSDDSVKAFLTVSDLKDNDYINSHYVVFVTKSGVVKRTLLEQFSRPRAAGIFAINLEKNDDELIGVALTDGESEVMLASYKGKAVRFAETEVRCMGRTAAGVRGMTLEGDDDRIVSMVVTKNPDEDSVMVISENGYGKRSVISDYRKTSRGAKGVRTINITEKTGNLVGFRKVTDDKDLIIINKSGVSIRFKISDFEDKGRATQGVRLIELKKRNDVIADICVVDTADEEELPTAELPVENGGGDADSPATENETTETTNQ
ncbi:MAG: DNA gyrase subunit A, partial [Bacteroidaceae bacterium]|nr:DNA gyrase subunit A [Bacteroidaceae bacterium]